MKETSLLLASLLSLGLTATGCKKKADEPVPTAKTGDLTRGSAAGSAVTPAAVDPNAPAPAATKNLLETAKGAGTFTTFLKAVDAAGIADNLNGAGPFTVFAPTDDAFAKLPAKDLEALLADKTKLGQVLQYHVISGTVSRRIWRPRRPRDRSRVQTSRSMPRAASRSEVPRSPSPTSSPPMV